MIPLWKKRLFTLLELLFAGTFFYAGMTKLLAPPLDFAESIASFQLFPTAWINSLAVSIPLFEIAAAIAILIPKTRSTGLFALTGLTLAFTGALAYAAYWNLPIDCGCFGSGSATSPRLGIARNLVLLTIGGGLYSQRALLQSEPSRPIPQSEAPAAK